MSQPPDYPGRRRVKRAAASLAGDAYQGAFEAVMAVLVGAGVGYWLDHRFGWTPVGVITGVVVGFAAMVLRLLRLGQELVPRDDGRSGIGERPTGEAQTTDEAGKTDFAPAEEEADRGPAETPALSDVWRDDETDGRGPKEGR